MMSTIDLTCPVEIFRTALPTEEVPAATLTLFNLSDRVISSAEVSLCLSDADNRETERLTFRGRALNGRPHSTFLMTVPCAPSEELKSLEATVEKVWFADNETWRRNPANVVEYKSNVLAVSPALTKLKYAAGETAVGYPSIQNSLWICICGRPNPENDVCCARCGRERDMVFARFNPESFSALYRQSYLPFVVHARDPENVFSVSRAVFVVVTADQRVDRRAERPRECDAAVQIRNAVAAFPFCYRLTRYADAFRKLFLRHSRAFAQAFYLVKVDIHVFHLAC